MLIAEVDGRPIGFLQIIDPAREETQYWRDVAANLQRIADFASSMQSSTLTEWREDTRYSTVTATMPREARYLQ